VYASSSFIISAALPLKYPHADNLNSRFTNGEIQDVHTLMRPHQRVGLLMNISHENSMTHPTGSKQSFMFVNYRPQEPKEALRLAFMLEKTLIEDSAPEYLMQFNVRQNGYLETTRFESCNFTTVLSRLQGCIENHWCAPSAHAGLTLVHS
jgi:hypothetical protein